MIGTYLSSIGRKSEHLEEGVVRHMVLNTIRSILFKNKSKFGKDVYIACDSHSYWRKDLFPLYKASRKKTREEDSIDWNKLFNYLNNIREELKENFPYKVIHVPKVEADDIIAYLCHKNGIQANGQILSSGEEKHILIVSGDKDFIQLHEYPNVYQYSPITKMFMTNNNPREYLIRQIISGDTGDGIPNILSDDDVFAVESKRQTPVRSKFADDITQKILSGQSPETILDPNVLRRWKRNESLINLNKIPTDIIISIDKHISEEENKPVKDKRSLMEYFAKNKMRVLIEKIGEF